ncbi:integrator complex subunit 2 [Syncephalastrum racemosum]|uniref:Integrator complex subunit 2 n=1 Tax=Syncephalastrum racemosum TaxID=13706 RepID=A0A1X2HB22_SYNRA|nr:integrator complex subunit 2 [Syncephalastrum racemosum]
MARHDSESLESFSQLLKARIFYGNVNYAEWLLNSMVNATLPIQPGFVHAIREFVSSVFVVDKVDRIPEETILPYFDESDTRQPTPTQVLLLFYIMSFNETFLTFKTDTKLVMTYPEATDRQQEYSPQLLQRIPVRIILNHIESYHAGEAYSGIYPDFISMTANMYPELFDVTCLLLKEGNEPDAYQELQRPQKITIEELHGLLDNVHDQPDKLLAALRYLGSFTSPQVVPYAEAVVMRLLPICLYDEQLDERIISGFLSLWETLDCIIPHELWTMTIKANQDKTLHELQELTFDLLVKEPLIMFKCDLRIFRSKHLLPMWLHVIGCLRVCSKHRIWRRYHTQQTEMTVRNVMALVNAQDSAMIQLLLQFCLPAEDDQEQDDPEKLRMAQTQICQFIHGVFADGDRDNLLAKILHFQTYSIKLIPIVVDLIPSLYIAFSFLPELLRQPQPEKQVFAILLACHLCKKYPIENYLTTTVNHALPRLLKLAFPPVAPNATPVCVPSEYLVQAIPAFVYLAEAYPDACANILEVYQEIAQGLPRPEEYMQQQANSKIILVLQCHQVLKDARDAVNAIQGNKEKEKEQGQV